jgi:26S proteasome regulatory subunit N1
LLSCAQYVPCPEDTEMYKVVLQIYVKMKQPAEALAVALKINSTDSIREVLNGCEDATLKKQLCFILGRHHQFDFDPEDEELADIISQSTLSEHFVNLGRELDVAEAKTPEDIYKTHLVEARFTSNVDSARKNLADTFVNAFVNAGFGQDKLMSTDGAKWVFRNKDHGMLSATASLGMILQWDVLNGINKMDKYTHMKVTSALREAFLFRIS